MFGGLEFEDRFFPKFFIRQSSGKSLEWWRKDRQENKKKRKRRRWKGFSLVEKVSQSEQSCFATFNSNFVIMMNRIKVVLQFKMSIACLFVWKKLLWKFMFVFCKRDWSCFATFNYYFMIMMKLLVCEKEVALKFYVCGL